MNISTVEVGESDGTKELLNVAGVMEIIGEIDHRMGLLFSDDTLRWRKLTTFVDGGALSVDLTANVGDASRRHPIHEGTGYADCIFFRGAERVQRLSRHRVLVRTRIHQHFCEFLGEDRPRKGSSEFATQYIVDYRIYSAVGVIKISCKNGERRKYAAQVFGKFVPDK